MCPSKSRDNDNKGSEASVNALEFNKNDRLWSINAVAAEPPAPTVVLHARSLNGEADVQVLPDSGANICAAGVQFLTKLGEREDNIGDSDIEPQTVNGKTMKPLGCLRVTFSTPDRTTEEIVHIYPGIKGALISWKAAVRLGFLPECYPTPLTNQTLAKISATNKVTREDLIAEFPKVFDGVIRTMPGEKFKIVLTDDAKPFCVNTPRTIPFPFREKLRELLDALLDAGIIASQTEPTDWCAPIVVVLKKDGETLRLCVDLSKLNKYVKRERYQSMTPALAVADITESCAKFFTSLDAVKGYHQCPLDEESQLLTTFITPFGRFKFLRAPFGVSSISEHYDRRMAEAFEGLGHFRRIVDDTLIYDADETQHIEHVRQFLRRCEEKGISLCRDKFRFCQKEIDFAGFRVTQGGYQINPEITKAITEFPTPSSRTDLRSFLGLVNQISGTSAEISKATTPLRPLLSTKNDFVWAAPHDEVFGVTKRLLSSAPIMAFYDANKPTRLLTDASRTGIGFVLQQQHGDEWLTIQANSRHLTDTEGRYAVIELEMFAVTWAIEKCRVFLAGLPTFLVVTDHNPLVPILNSHRLDEIENPRLQRLRTRLMAYNFTAKWLKGKENSIADSLSGYPTEDPKRGDDLAEYDLDTSHTVCSVQAPTNADLRRLHADETNLRLQEVLKHALDDPEYQQLKRLIMDGFPATKGELPDRLKKYWRMHRHLSVDDDFIVFGCRLFVPESLRPEMLSRLHEGHQGITRSQNRARLTLYWPSIDQDIRDMVDNCQHCQDRLPSNPQEPIQSKPRPSRPFQHVAADFAQYGGCQFLITVDCFTDWPEVFNMGNNTSAKALIASIRALFCRSAAPDVFWSDQGPQFMADKFQKFLKDWGVIHKTSSPRYPQSNGKAEAAVKSMKKLIAPAWRGRSIDQNKLQRSLMQYRNTPCPRDGRSPAQKLYGHPVQDTLPAHRRSFAPEWQKTPAEGEMRYKEVLEKAETAYNQHAQSLPDIKKGTNVAVKNPVTKMWDIYGIVTDVSPRRRYFIRTQSGSILVRNRRFLRRRTPISVHGYTPGDLSVQPAPTQQEAAPPQQEGTPRRSTRTRHRTKRLIEEI